MAETIWDAYLGQVLRDDGVDTESLQDQLVAAKRVFRKDKSRISIHDVAKEGAITEFNVVSEADLRRAEQARPSTGMRIISIHSDRTIAPLWITPGVASEILRSYAVRSDFVPVLLSFADEPHPSEASNSNFVYASPSDDNAVVSYNLNFVERNQHGGTNPWSFRHAGIYHHRRGDFNLFIIIHCTKETAFFRRMTALLSPPVIKKATAVPSSSQAPPAPGIGTAAGPLLQQICKHPEKLHSLLISCYSNNWRPYLRSLGKKFADPNDRAMVDDADAVKQASFPTVQALRNTNDFALFANACCSNNLDILDRLSRIPFPSAELTFRQRTESQALTLQGHIASCKVLQDRISNTIELVGYTLTLHNQIETGKLDKEIRDMTKKLQELSQKSVDDSTVVRLITILSAVYLPGSFVGGIFGMNFFVFDTDHRKIVIAHDFWIFVLVWLGLSALTALAFVFTWWRKKKQKDATEEDAAREKPS